MLLEYLPTAQGGGVQAAVTICAVDTALARFRDWCAANGFAFIEEAPSEVAGAEGNREIFVHLEPVPA